MRRARVGSGESNRGGGEGTRAVAPCGQVADRAACEASGAGVRECQWLLPTGTAGACAALACEGVVLAGHCAVAPNCRWSGGACSAREGRFQQPRPWEALQGAYVSDEAASGTQDPAGWWEAQKSPAQLRAGQFDLDREQEAFCFGANGSSQPLGEGGGRVVRALVAEALASAMGIPVPQSALLMRSGDQRARLRTPSSLGTRPTVLVPGLPSTDMHLLLEFAGGYRGHCPLVQSSNELERMLRERPHDPLVLGFYDATANYTALSLHLAAAASAVERSAVELRALAEGVVVDGWGVGGEEQRMRPAPPVEYASHTEAMEAMGAAVQATSDFNAKRHAADAAVVELCQMRARGGWAARNTTFAIANFTHDAVEPGGLLMVRSASDLMPTSATLAGRGAQLLGGHAVGLNTTRLAAVLQETFYPSCLYLGGKSEAKAVVDDNTRVIAIGLYETEDGVHGGGAAAATAAAEAANRSAAFCQLARQFGTVRFAVGSLEVARFFNVSTPSALLLMVGGDTTEPAAAPAHFELDSTGGVRQALSLGVAVAADLGPGGALARAIGANRDTPADRALEAGLRSLAEKVSGVAGGLEAAAARHAGQSSVGGGNSPWSTPSDVVLLLLLLALALHARARDMRSKSGQETRS
jgi:hypothetical protein